MEGVRRGERCVSTYQMPIRLIRNETSTSPGTPGFLEKHFHGLQRALISAGSFRCGHTHCHGNASTRTSHACSLTDEAAAGAKLLSFVGTNVLGPVQLDIRILVAQAY